MFSHHVFRRATLIGTIALGIACTATAQTSPPAPVTGLGEPWPNATDVSTSPDWHAYVFQKDGMRYIQINDRNGTVHAAIGQAAHRVFALPVGVDAQRVAVVGAPNAQGPSETIYQDDTVTIEAAIQNDGGMSIVAISECGDPLNCTYSTLQRE